MAKLRISIIGLGLIGGSIGLALKKSKLDLEVIGHDKDLGVAGRAVKRGAVDKTEWNLISACDGASLIVLAMPLDGIRDTLTALRPHLSPGTLITDTAMTKVPVLEWASELPRNVEFVGGNPIINPKREISGQGIDAADATLFQDATYCLIPAVSASAQAIDVMSGFVNVLGAKPYFIEAAEHDGLMAGVHHLPALLATAYAASIIGEQGWIERSKVASATFRAAMDLVPTDKHAAPMQFLAHREDLMRWIDHSIVKLRELRTLLDTQNSDALGTLVQTIADERAKWQSGQLDRGALPASDMSQVSDSFGRLFLGGLSERMKRAK
ncbi:MAG: prephenate dehydrogenase/arogenate dehydrogenase family protein [Anaerolineae bacterium]|nr:prephenate dehydrogenase/arogenate dehydrogenase family protein [Anaerolineae bacterium]